jgi:zinc protease
MRVTHRDEKVRQPSHLASCIARSATGRMTGRQAHALDVAIEILGGSETSRLYRALVEEQRIAIGAARQRQHFGPGWRQCF